MVNFRLKVNALYTARGFERKGFSTGDVRAYALHVFYVCFARSEWRKGRKNVRDGFKGPELMIERVMYPFGPVTARNFVPTSCLFENTLYTRVRVSCEKQKYNIIEIEREKVRETMREETEGQTFHRRRNRLYLDVPVVLVSPLVCLSRKKGSWSKKLLDVHSIITVDGRTWFSNVRNVSLISSHNNNMSYWNVYYILKRPQIRRFVYLTYNFIRILRLIII